MINKRFSIFYLLLAMFAITACEKNNFVVDKDPLEVATYVKFATNNLLNQNYFVEDISTSQFKIPIGLTHASTTETKIQLAYTSKSAVSGLQFSGPSEITIPAGQVLDTLRITGLFSGLANGRKDTVSVKITGSNMPKATFNDSASIILQRFCPITNSLISAFAGIYDNTREYRSTGVQSYGPYTTAVKDIVLTSATTAEAMVENIYDFGWADVKIILDWSDPFSTKVTVPSQDAGGGYMVKTAAARNGSFSSCEGSIDIIIDISGAETVTNYTVRLRR